MVFGSFRPSIVLLASLVAASFPAPSQLLPNGMTITPLAAPGSSIQLLKAPGSVHLDFTAGQPVTTALSPDGKTLLVLTSGFNRMMKDAATPIPDESTEYVFVFDATVDPPAQRQVLRIPNTFAGITFSPDGTLFHLTGGTDDVVYSYGWVGTTTGGSWTLVRPPTSLGHAQGLGLGTAPMAAGIAITGDGRLLAVANYENDSLSLLDAASGNLLSEIDLRPGKSRPSDVGVPGGGYPFWVVAKGTRKLYVSAVRDREIVVLDVEGSTPLVTGRIPVPGQPNRMLLDASQARLYVALDNADAVGVVDTATDRLVETIPVTAPAGSGPPVPGGSNPNALALSPDGRTLFVANGGTNCIAVVRLAGGTSGSAVLGLVPTGWYPTSVAVSPDGRRLWVTNSKSVPGPNPLACRDSASTDPQALDRCRAASQYVLQLSKGGLATIPVPIDQGLAQLTTQVATNGGWVSPLTQEQRDRNSLVMALLRRQVKHVVYVIKENRTYDQVLGDLGVGKGDPFLTLFPDRVTPNHHALARQFVTIDNFFAAGEESASGWSWTTGGRVNDATEKAAPLYYASRGMPYSFEGTNRNVNPGLPTLAERKAANPLTPDDPDLLPGTADVAEHDATDGSRGKGYLWDAALKAGLSVRNYGGFTDPTRYSLPEGWKQFEIPLLREPWTSGTRVAWNAKATLVSLSDPYYRGYDQAFPDYWRFKAWEREFDAAVQSGSLPALQLVQLCHDRFGSFETAIDGVNTPTRQMADNDYALGLLVQKIARSRFADSTMIFVVEDDAQDGPDHVDAQRSLAFVVGPGVKRGTVVSTRYTTLNVLKTIEVLLGLPPLGIFDAAAEPMADLFEVHLFPPKLSAWDYAAIVPAPLRETQLPLPPASAANAGTAEAAR